MSLPKQFCFTSLFLVLVFTVSAQDFDDDIEILPRPDRITSTEPLPKKSPMNSASMRSSDGYIRIVYSQPMLRGRQMLGDQVRYGKVWRAGANEATEVFITQNIKIAGKDLPAGAYSMYVIPNEDEWTVIFNTDLGQWGAYNYNEENDQLRFNYKTEPSKERFEAYTMYFDAGKLIIVWANTKLELPIEFASTAQAPQNTPSEYKQESINISKQ